MRCTYLLKLMLAADAAVALFGAGGLAWVGDCDWDCECPRPCDCPLDGDSECCSGPSPDDMSVSMACWAARRCLRAERCWDGKIKCGGLGGVFVSRRTGGDHRWLPLPALQQQHGVRVLLPGCGGPAQGGAERLQVGTVYKVR